MDASSVCLTPNLRVLSSLRGSRRSVPWILTSLWEDTASSSAWPRRRRARPTSLSGTTKVKLCVCVVIRLNDLYHFPVLLELDFPSISQ